VSIIAWIVVGLIAGFLAHLIAGGRAGIIGDVFLGILGAIVGGFAAPRLHLGHVSGINLDTIVVATIGAVIVLVAWHAIEGNRHLVRF
jgi:uncharacterized membrane protein YeaQ/YmgE (transglycosylase-associated protein family)